MKDQPNASERIIRRRDLIAIIGSAALAPMAAAAAAQQTGAPKVGWLKIQDKNDTPGWLYAFRAAMRAHGQEEGHTFTVEERYADGDATRLGTLSEELVRAGVAVIVATSQPATDAARRVTKTIPIVGRMTDDPVQNGTAASLARPGGNVTGPYSLLEAMTGKRLELLSQAVPTMRRPGALATRDRGATRHWLEEADAAARRMDLTLHVMDVHEPGDLPGLFAVAADQNVDGLIAFRNPTVVTYAKQVIDLSARYRMPGIFDARDFVDAGAFMSYGPNLDDIFSRIAFYVDKILKGENPADLPIEQPTTFELVINLKSAKALGLTIPPTVLVRANEVIE